MVRCDPQRLAPRRRLAQIAVGASIFGIILPIIVVSIGR